MEVSQQRQGEGIIFIIFMIFNWASGPSDADIENSVRGYMTNRVSILNPGGFGSINEVKVLDKSKEMEGRLPAKTMKHWVVDVRIIGQGWHKTDYTFKVYKNENGVWQAVPHGAQGALSGVGDFKVFLHVFLYPKV